MSTETARRISLSDGRCLGYAEYGDPERLLARLAAALPEPDRIVPPSMARMQENEIPACRSAYYPDEGHFSVVVNHVDEIFETLVNRTLEAPQYAASAPFFTRECSI